MDLEGLKNTVRDLSAEDRRKLALYILELEKDHFQKNIGSQIAEDMEGFSKVIQESAEKIKKTLKDGLG